MYARIWAPLVSNPCRMTERERAKAHLGERKTLVAERALATGGVLGRADRRPELHQTLVPGSRLVAATGGEWSVWSRDERVREGPDEGRRRFCGRWRVVSGET